MDTDKREAVIRVNPYYYLAESSHAAQIFPRRPRSRPRPRLGVWARLRGRGRRRGRFGCGCAAPCASVVDSFWLRLCRAVWIRGCLHYVPGAELLPSLWLLRVLVLWLFPSAMFCSLTRLPAGCAG